MNFINVASNAYVFLTSPAHPALTVGLTIFTFLGLVTNICTGNILSNALALSPSSLRHFQLNNLSFYSMTHNNCIHWLFNMIALFPPLSAFERAHGTVHTGVTLNLLTVLAGIQYCLIASLLAPNTRVIGISGITFLLITFTAVKEHATRPSIHLGNIGSRDIYVPTLYTPFLFLFACHVLVPDSLFYGHLSGITTGFLLAKGYLKILYPPSWIILAIESRLERPISILAPLVVFYKEDEAAAIRSAGYVSPCANDQESLIILPSTLDSQFPGQGQALGSDSSL